MAPKFHHSQHSKSETKSEGKMTTPEDRVQVHQNRVSQINEKERGNYLFQQFILTSPDILFILDLETNATRIFNSSTNKKLQHSSISKLISENNFFNSLFPEDRLELLGKMRKLHQKSEISGFDESEIRFLGSDSKINFFNLRFTPHSFTEDNQVREWFVLARDITSEKENLKAAQDSQLKLQMALDGSNMGVWSYDPATQKIECDPRTRKILGLSEFESENDVNKIFSRIHPEDRSLAFETAFRTLRRKGRFNHDLRLVHPLSNIIRHIAVVGELISDERAQVTKVTGICMDISEHKVAENKIKTNETFLEESQRIAKIGGFDWDLSLDKVHCTAQLHEILDISPRESFSLKNFYSKVFPEDLSGVKSAVDSAVKNGDSFDKEFRFLAGEKLKIIWAHGQASRKGGRTCRIIGTFQDITEKKEKEKEFNTQNLIIRSILRHLPVIIQIVEKDGKIHSLLGSAGLGRIGKKENETVGENIFDQDPSAAFHIKKALSGETVNFTQEMGYNGRKFYFLSFYFYDAERELAIGFSIDVTAQKQAEAAFQQVTAKNQELERMNKVMDMFVYAVAHDLKNPINNLEMLNELMKEAVDPDEQKDYADALQKSVKRLKQTIGGLTEIIQIESSRNAVHQEVELSAVLDHVQADLQTLLHEKNGKIEACFKEPKISYNQAFLTSILKNLISNSIKYADSSRPALIKVETEKKRGYITLTVKDNGIGIDLQNYGKSLFKPFKRFTKQAEGTGVGLHLIKSMVEKSGGKIEVESTLGEGTAFRCFLKPSSE